MEFQEYPKALYKGGQIHIVDNTEQEDAAREAGHLDWHDDQARLNQPDTDSDVDQQPLDREALKAEATALGIQFAKNIKTEQLAEMVAAQKA